MRYLLTLAILIVSVSAMAQPDFNISKDEESGQLVYKGAITFADLEKETSFDWFSTGYREYKPDADIITFLKAQLPNYHLLVFMGTWCDDSHNLIPKLKKILDLTGFPMEHYKMYAVDKQKQSRHEETKKNNVLFVPTIILQREDKDKGRIIESVRVSLEADLQKLIKKDMEQIDLMPKIEK